MALYGSIVIAAGTDLPVGSLTAVETITGFAAPKMLPRRVPFGNRQTRTLDQKQHWEGDTPLEWQWAFHPYEKLGTLVNNVAGWGTQNVAVTIQWLDRDNAWQRYNAIMHIPVEGEHYEQPDTNKALFNDVVENLRIVFTDVNLIS